VVEFCLRLSSPLIYPFDRLRGSEFRRRCQGIQEGNDARRVARPLQLNLGCPVLRLLKGGVFDLVLKFCIAVMSRLTRITFPDSTTSSFTYDSRGRRTSVTDQNEKTTTYAYGTESNLIRITDANIHVTTFTYDAFGRVTKTTFP
jgi:YD repeat-containing protein